MFRKLMIKLRSFYILYIKGHKHKPNKKEWYANEFDYNFNKINVLIVRDALRKGKLIKYYKNGKEFYRTFEDKSND